MPCMYFSSLLLLAGCVQAMPVPSLSQRALSDHKVNVLGYIPSITWAVFFLIIYGGVAIALTWRYFRLKANYMLPMIIGLYAFIGGLALRFQYRNNPYNLNLYIVLNSLVVLSPCAFIATVYSILGQIAGRIPGGEQYMLISSRRVTLVFVLSDVFTFLIQGTGGALVTRDGMQNTGQKLFLLGLILQLVSFIFFCGMYARWLILVRLREPEIWTRDARETWLHDWRTLAAALAISCISIVVRCLYRVIELSEGFSGHLATTEWYFFILDALPLAIACCVFAICWPENYLLTPKPAFHSIPLASADNRGLLRK